MPRKLEIPYTRIQDIKQRKESGNHVYWMFTVCLVHKTLISSMYISLSFSGNLSYRYHSYPACEVEAH